jgi:hypothetical protein
MSTRRFLKPALPWPLLAAILLTLCWQSAAAVVAAPPVRRSQPPSTTWDNMTAAAFSDDAFTVLSGSRPDFGAGPRLVVSPGGGSEPAAGGGGDGFKWSTLISGDTLTDEIKDLKDRVTATATTPSTFKGGGYNDAREAFSMLALAFGLIAAHDQDIRWKRDAATARDLFARAGFNCKVGTDQTFNESRLRIEDLEGMIQGSPPKGKPEQEEDFRWSQVAGRPPMMSRLELAGETMNAAIASQADFKGKADRLFHEAELVAAIGEVICQPDFEYFDDETYVEYAGTMRDAAVAVRKACLDQDYDAARAAVGEISKSCDTCHGDYR